MRHRKPVVGASLVLVAVSLVSIFFPGPNFGIDFAGGTELQVVFGDEVSAAELRQELEGLGHSRPDVVRVESDDVENIIRIREVTTIGEGEEEEFRQRLETLVTEAEIEQVEFSPGGDKICLLYTSDAADE